MTIALRAVTTPSAVGSTTVTVAKPTGTLEGDLMLMCTSINAESASILQPPAGWYLVRGGSLNDDDATALWWKVAGASEPTSYDVTTNLSSVISAGILSLYSDSAAEIAIDDVTTAYNASGDLIYPSVTLSAEGFVVCCGTPHSFSSTPAAGFTERWDTGGSQRTHCMTKASVSAGATGTITATSLASQSNQCITVALVEGAMSYAGPQFRSSSTYGPTSSTTSFTVAIPSDVVAGDMLLLQVVPDADRTIDTPTGWDSIAALTGAGSLRLYSRVAEVGDAGSNVTVSFSGATTFMAAAIVAYWSPTGKSLTIGDVATGSGTAASAITFPTVTAGATNAALACFGSNTDTTGVKCLGHIPFWERVDIGSTGCHAVVCSELLVADGATGTRSADFTSSTHDYFAVAVTIEEVIEGILFNGTDLRPWLRTWSLESNVRIADTTILTSTAQEQIPILSDWLFNMTGLWTVALDDVLGTQVVQSQDADNSFFMDIEAAVSYESATTFVSRYRVEMTIDDVIVWSGAVAISGAPERSVL